MALPIEDYAMIGDCQSAALVGRDGSVDWLCLPRFDSPACFAALLGTEANGCWKIAPVEPARAVRRCYRGDTLILETEFETASGRVAVIDFMPPRSVAPDMVRIVVGRAGRVSMRLELTIRFGYGSIIPWVRHIESGLRAIAGPDTLYCRTPVELHGENMHTIAEFDVGEGDRIPFTLTWGSTHHPEPPVRDPEESLRRTESWWRSWSDQCTYAGPQRDAVMRSLITLKALTSATTGGLVAAATTSLPEKIGGVRNWDYRYCWLRDATFTLYALITGGYMEEARRWRDWLVTTVAGTPSQIQIMYGLAGERRLTEYELPWLEGYEKSQPVRVGNSATAQHQLDVYGEVMDALHLARQAGLEANDDAWRVQRGLLRFLETVWRKPDEGIWEVRGPRRHFVHSKVMAWVAMDRGVKAIDQFDSPGDAAKWRRIRDQIHKQVCRDGFNPKLNSFVQSYDAEVVDASLLIMPLVGFIDANDPRMRGTVDAIQRQLTRGGFLERYPSNREVDGLPPGEGVFLLCSFWLVDCLAAQGRLDEAHELFDRLLALRNDVGLLSEEFDPEQQRLLGNFPQAFSHVGVVNSARILAQYSR